MHTHEKWIDGKRYLDEIRSCECRKKTGERYELECSIHQRGTGFYSCDGAAKTIMRDGTKIWYLTPEARKTVLAAIRSFEKDSAAMETDESLKIGIPEGDMTVSVQRKSKAAFDAFFCYADPKNPAVRVKLRLKKEPIGEIIRETAHLLYRKEKHKKLSDLLYNTCAETLPENPFYRAALERGDDLLPRQIRLFYNLATDEDLGVLQRIFRKRVLPALSEEFDRTFTVIAKTIDYGLLNRSGYQFCHRPYFAMRNCTHSLCELNPHKKSGVDAGNDDVEPMTFEQYLALFDRKDHA